MKLNSSGSSASSKGNCSISIFANVDCEMIPAVLGIYLATAASMAANRMLPAPMPRINPIILSAKPSGVILASRAMSHPSKLATTTVATMIMAKAAMLDQSAPLGDSSTASGW